MRGDTNVALFLLDWEVLLKFIMSTIKSTPPQLQTLFWVNVSHHTDFREFITSAKEVIFSELFVWIMGLARLS